MGLIGKWTLRGLTCSALGAGLFLVAPGCGSGDSAGSGLGGAGNKDGGGGTGAAGATGGVGGSSATGGTAGNPAGGTGGGNCTAPLETCDGVCVATQTDPSNCGTCGNACLPEEYCKAGACTSTCVGGQICGTPPQCVNVSNDPANCGACDAACPAGDNCVNGACTSGCAGATLCGAVCVNIQIDPQNCGACGTVCGGTQLCQTGACVDTCSGGLLKCGNSCVNSKTDKNNCGACGNICPTGQDCINSACAVCNSATTDCDGDGWNGTDGDCCDKSGVCGANPELVNPGAYEVVGNGVDDNCNGLADLFDKLDTQPCDATLTSNSSVGTDYAKAIDVCRTTSETPATLKDKTWGLISADILRADGTPLGDQNAKSIRPKFGSSINPLKGTSLAVIAAGIASDGTQTNPGPNGGAPTGFNVSASHSPSSNVNIQSCASADCVDDWFSTANPPLKAANAYPNTPACGGAGGGGTANDSVMLKFRLRAPTNARAFSFNSYFFSAEYPEWVCTTFNDQFIALVTTPSGVPSPIPNPVDKNLMTYTDLSTQPPTKFPIGINVANGTNLFAVCDPGVLTPSSGCYDQSIAAASCSLGAGELTGTGFEKPTTGTCVIGGGTYWLTTAGNVIPGQIVELRIVIFDVGDNAWDSMALIDGFEWLPNATLPGTG